MTTLAQKYFMHQKALFEHVEFTPDWVEYAITDETKHYWKIIDDKKVRYSESIENLKHALGEYYEDHIYTQRFYPKHVYRGSDFTMIFCDPGVDNCKWFRIFDNKKEIN